MSKIISFLNSKGGSGKSTVAIHTALFFAEIQYKVCLIDLDEKQHTSHTFFENRKSFIEKYKKKLPTVKTIICDSKSLIHNLTKIQNLYDIFIIDTPGFYISDLFKDTINLSNLVVSPINESFIDIHALKISNFFNDMVHIRGKQKSTGNKLNWLIVTNRRSCIYSDHYKEIMDSLKEIQGKYSCKIFEGFFENSIFKEMFPHGLSLLDHDHLNFAPSNNQKKGREIIKNYMLELVRLLFRENT